METILRIQARLRAIEDRYGNVMFERTSTGRLLGVWKDHVYHKVVIRLGEVYLEENKYPINE